MCITNDGGCSELISPIILRVEFNELISPWSINRRDVKICAVFVSTTELEGAHSKKANKATLQTLWCSLWALIDVCTNRRNPNCAAASRSFDARRRQICDHHHISKETATEI